MFKNHISKLLVVPFLALFISCTQKNTDTQSTKALMGETITAEKQAALTPQTILASLKEGNERYVNNDLTARDLQAQVKATATGQYPEAVILSCIDSRVPVEHVFDKGVGDVFVARVAGNTVNPDILGSIEYGAAVAGSKVIVVMGHEACGAVKASIDEADLSDNADVLLDRVNPAIEAVQGYDDRTSANGAFVDDVVKTNVDMTIDEMLVESPVLKGLLDKGEIMIVGAYYDLDTGKVTFVEN
ncbi:MAG TPA: carbonic anhydrase [Balneola sp.]|jgi:carbonic anhydrase|nr:carbonic anhydrase [Balneola sp.]MAO78005.1 carbonic anhydrase [Balneola sp.]MBF64006.1 carbonic anhydrase [Balneola sp.]HAH50933.1 carbonic anhydrase [Balneola sp.]HAW82019.1 carbonic anhydrase [Balneola sp.]|tara:strand:- start:4122 stop:4853 length:732 start_codon:yes stop_codon:yes gene_type:complete